MIPQVLGLGHVWSNNGKPKRPQRRSNHTGVVSIQQGAGNCGRPTRTHLCGGGGLGRPEPWSARGHIDPIALNPGLIRKGRLAVLARVGYF